MSAARLVNTALFKAPSWQTYLLSWWTKMDQQYMDSRIMGQIVDQISVAVFVSAADCLVSADTVEKLDASETVRKSSNFCARVL
jgi:hypothetical protein